MELFTYVKARQWHTIFGYGLFVGMMAVGYYYNVTFVQLGLVDLGTRLMGLEESRVAGHMAVLALLTLGIALLVGWLMTRRGWSADFVVKLRLAFLSVLLQTILTAVAPFIRSESFFLAWMIGCSVALGIGVPATFSLTVDLVPVRDRGYVAALIAAAAYFAAPVFSGNWQIEWFATQMLLVMPPGVVGLGLLAWRRWPWAERLACQHEQPAFGWGRFARDGVGRRPLNRRLWGFILLMFGIFFVDSLGFLRIIATPLLVESAWLSPEMSPRLFIGGIHVVAALIAGVLYTSLNARHLFYWIFGLFALVHLMYTFPHPFQVGTGATLAEPMLYAIAVSLYTVVNFALWADLSTPRTIGLHSALGVAFSGWAATFLSTALAIHWRTGGMSVERHLSLVDALAMLFFLALLVIALLWGDLLATRAARQRPNVKVH